MTPQQQALIDLDLDPQAEFRRLFPAGRAPRSLPYRIGVGDALEHFLRAKKPPAPPYAMGTAQCDAYFAGWDEGRLHTGRLRAELTA